MRHIRFYANNCMFNVKHLALTDLIFLLVLILQIGNSTYFSATSVFHLGEQSCVHGGKI